MSTGFHPENAAVKLCMQGMQLEVNGRLKEAGLLFLQAWDSAADDFEKFLAAWLLARNQPTVTEKIRWYERALDLASTVGDDGIKSAVPSLHKSISKCYGEIGDFEKAAMHQVLALS